MYVEPVGPEVTLVLGWAREIAVIGTVLVFGWKARDAVQGIFDFLKDVRDFMKDMRGFAFRMETNHLRHMEASLDKMAKASPTHYVDQNLEPIIEAAAPSEQGDAI